MTQVRSSTASGSCTASPSEVFGASTTARTSLGCAKSARPARTVASTSSKAADGQEGRDLLPQAPHQPRRLPPAPNQRCATKKAGPGAQPGTSPSSSVAGLHHAHRLIGPSHSGAERQPVRPVDDGSVRRACRHQENGTQNGFCRGDHEHRASPARAEVYRTTGISAGAPRGVAHVVREPRDPTSRKGRTERGDDLRSGHRLQRVAASQPTVLQPAVCDA
jgi:hypothetical protein